MTSIMYCVKNVNVDATEAGLGLIKLDHLLKIFWTKMGPLFKDEKLTHFGGTTLYSLTCEYLPPPIH